MAISWAFIYVAKGCEPEKHNATIDSPGWKSTFIGVDNVDLKLSKMRCN
ncbi:MAG: DUF6506 family protein [Tepidanaerobacteraceae bacterium]